jgi:hypothetical protein
MQVNEPMLPGLQSTPPGAIQDAPSREQVDDRTVVITTHAEDSIGGWQVLHA